MADKKKIIEDLQGIVDECRGADAEFAYGISVDFLEDALDMLKWQEPVTPGTDVFGNLYCGNCQALFPESAWHVWHFCPHCGKELDIK